MRASSAAGAARQNISPRCDILQVLMRPLDLLLPHSPISKEGINAADPQAGGGGGFDKGCSSPAHSFAAAQPKNTVRFPVL